MDLTLDGVGTRLGGRWVVDGIDATPPTGHLTGLLGPNGAGKTTLLRLVAGLLPPEKGAVLIHETPVHDAPAADACAPDRPARAGVDEHRPADRPRGRVAGPHPVPEPVGHRSRRRRGRPRARQRAGGPPGRPPLVARCPAAERQRVQIARALAQEPDVLLLDEPTNHLDVSAQLSLLAFVRDLGTTTVAALHDLNLAAAFCEHVLVLADGHLAAAGHPREVLTPALLRQVYGVEADILEHPRTGRPVIAFHEPTRSP